MTAKEQPLFGSILDDNSKPKLEGEEKENANLTKPSDLPIVPPSSPIEGYKSFENDIDFVFDCVEEMNNPCNTLGWLKYIYSIHSIRPFLKKWNFEEGTLSDEWIDQLSQYNGLKFLQQNDLWKEYLTFLKISIGPWNNPHPPKIHYANNNRYHNPSSYFSMQNEPIKLLPKSIYKMPYYQVNQSASINNNVPQSNIPQPQFNSENYFPLNGGATGGMRNSNVMGEESSLCLLQVGNQTVGIPLIPVKFSNHNAPFL